MECINRNTKAEELIEMAPSCRCSKCSNGCKFGSGFLFEEDAKKIAQYIGLSLESFRKEYLEEFESFNTKAFRFKLVRKNNMPYGKCIFFRDGICSIHDVKPLHCKISTGCKPHGKDVSLWFMLNYFVNPYDKESVKEYEQYLKTGGETLENSSIKEIMEEIIKSDEK